MNNTSLAISLRTAASDPRNWDIRGLLLEAGSVIDANPPATRAGAPEGYRSGRWVIRDGDGFPPR